MSRAAWALLLIGASLLLLPLSGTATRSQRIANAIAVAEGFYVAGSRAQRNNNPGNLTRDMGYPSSGMDGMFVIFDTVEDGWNALIRLVDMMLDGSSAYYAPDMSISEVAAIYTTTEQAFWASNVASELGVAVSTPINQV